MYNHAPPDYVCPFCVLLRGVPDARTYSRETDIVYCAETVTALVSSHQWAGNAPNVLIVPNAHFENLYDLPAHYGGEIQAVARLIAFALKASYGCDGVSTRQHNEPAGSQDVWHYHVHVTPRWQGDEFYSRTRQKQVMSADERASHAERLRTYLSSAEPGLLTRMKV